MGSIQAKVPHAQGRKRGTVLGEGQIRRSSFLEVSADLLGLSKAAVEEQKPAGTIRIWPLDRY